MDLGIVDQKVAAKELADVGLSSGLVSILMLAARSLETVAGFALAFGIFSKWAALGLLLFLAPATLIGHPFWRLAGTPEFLFIMGASQDQRRMKQ